MGLSREGKECGKIKFIFYADNGYELGSEVVLGKKRCSCWSSSRVVMSGVDFFLIWGYLGRVFLVLFYFVLVSYLLFYFKLPWASLWKGQHINQLTMLSVNAGL